MSEPGALGPKKPFTPPLMSTPQTTTSQGIAQFRNAAKEILPPGNYTIHIDNTGAVSDIEGLPESAQPAFIEQLNNSLGNIQSAIQHTGGNAPIRGRDISVSVPAATQ